MQYCIERNIQVCQTDLVNSKYISANKTLVIRPTRKLKTKKAMMVIKNFFQKNFPFQILMFAKVC